jgi:nucleotide-binding universal stress UspA family protein
MLSLKRLLLPTDFSPRSKSVATYATELARHFEASLTMVHVLPPIHMPYAAMDGGGALFDQVLQNQRDLARKQLDSFLLSELNGFSVTRVLLEGDPADAVVHYAHANDISLIMMATRGCGPFRGFILGSVTAKVLHDADCPVWTGTHVEENATGVSSGVRTVVCAVDVTPESAVPLRWAANFASESQARLIVVEAIPPLDFNPWTYYMDVDRQQRIATEAKREVAKMLKGCCSEEAEIRVESGNIPRVVRSTTEDLRADLLVIGRASTPGILGRLRTNSYAIIRESPCPVVSV